MLPDSHIHTSFSQDSSALPESQISQCIHLGMKELCITDHHDYEFDPEKEAFLLDFDAYLPYMQCLRQKYADRIQVNIGVELGLQLHTQEYLENLSQRLEVDFIIGSSHFIDKKDPYYSDFFEGESEQEVYKHYFEVTLDRIRALDCFDSFGHLDYIVRYGSTSNRHYSFQAYQDQIDPILKALIEKGKALECNTAGFRYSLNHPNPCEDILKRYHELGGELLTLGSDAHSPKAIACEFDRMQAILKDCGFRYITVYRQRKPYPLPL